MKKYNLLMLAILFLQSCTEVIKPLETINMIKKVETSLINPVYIEGDAKWSLEDRMKHYGIPGVSIAVINNGKVEWTKAYGVMDKETKFPVTEKTLFQAASISKPVTSYGALTLVEQSKVCLDENINSFLKSWKLPDNEFTKDKKVTLKNLLNHYSGVTVHGFLGYSPDLPVPTLIQILNGTAPANSAASIVDKVPEESYRYSGGGYNIIQQMMIDVENKTFPELMNDLVLKPLEMKNSTFNQPLTREQLKMAATGYLPNGTMTNGKRHTYPEMAPAGLWTNAEDLAKFVINIQQTLKSESKIGLSKEMTTKMLTPFKEGFMGLGMYVVKRKEEIYFAHGGWNEGFSSEFMAHKDKGYGVIVLTNSNHREFISELIRSVAYTYNWKDYFPIYKDNKLEIEQSFITEISGRYRINGNELIEVFQEDNRLFVKQLGNESIELVKISDSSFVKRDVNQLIQFRLSLDDKRMNMQILNSNNETIISTYTKMLENEKMPIEFLFEGNFTQSLDAYQALKNADVKDPTIGENNLNYFGYDFISKKRIMMAHDILKINMILYPNSYNVYDSYAEVCMKMGKIDLAIENYNKSLELNPQNNQANMMIKELQKNM